MACVFACGSEFGDEPSHVDATELAAFTHAR